MLMIFINNEKHFFDKNLTILQACEKINLEIPKFCYNDRLSVAGNCRMCLVEVEKSPKPVVACATPLVEGMSIFTNSPLVKKARESVLEFLLINHPLDCPICDQGGECDLQDQTRGFGSDRNRSFRYNKRLVQDKDCGPIIKTIMTRCIHCTRCVRFVSEMTGKYSFGTLGRGKITEIGTYVETFVKTELSGNLIDICPVGALTAKPYAFSTRSWELKKQESIDYSDAIGSNINIFTRNLTVSEQYRIQDFQNQKEKILRILPKFNQEINESWISDKTRFGFDGLYIHRLIKPFWIDKLFLENNKKNLSIFNNYDWSFFINKFSIDIEKNQYGFLNPSNQKMNIKKWLKNNLKNETVFKNSFKYSIKNKYNILLKNKLFKQKKIIGIFGDSLGLKSIESFLSFLHILGIDSIWQQNSNNYFNKDFPLYYMFNSLIKNIEKVDLFLLIDSNPRFEASMINMRINKNYNRGFSKIYNFGLINDLYYKYEHKGNSTKSLLNFLQGKDFGACNFRNSKKPLSIFGNNIISKNSGFFMNQIGIQIDRFGFLQTSKINGLNFLHSSLSSLQNCELNVNNKSNLTLVENIDNKSNIIISLQNDSFSKSKFVSNAENTKIYFLSTHNTEKLNVNSRVIFLPIQAVYEKNEISMNVEGRIQISKKAVTAPSSWIRKSEDILETILWIQKDNNVFRSKVKGIDEIKWQKPIWSYKIKEENAYKKSVLKNRKWSSESELIKNSIDIFIENKNLLNFYYAAENKQINNFVFNRNIIYKRINRFFYVNFSNSISNFYMTDLITKNSPLMSICSLFNQNLQNFYKKN